MGCPTAVAKQNPERRIEYDLFLFSSSHLEVGFIANQGCRTRSSGELDCFSHQEKMGS